MVNSELVLYLPLLVVLVVAALKVHIEQKQRSKLGLFLQIQILVAVVAYLIAPNLVSVFMFYLPVLAYPVWSSWIKPTERILWRTTSLIFLLMALLLPGFLIHRIRMPLPYFLFMPILLSVMIIFPLYVLNFIDWKKRREKQSN